MDDGGPSEQLKRRLSTDSTPPSSQQDSQDNARLDSQRSCVDDGHISPTPPSQVLALTWHYDMWLHVACIASNFVELHLLTLHIMPVNMTRVPISRT